jgi:hypothetical protein
MSRASTIALILGRVLVLLRSGPASRPGNGAVKEDRKKGKGKRIKWMPLF